MGARRLIQEYARMYVTKSLSHFQFQSLNGKFVVLLEPWLSLSDLEKCFTDVPEEIAYEVRNDFISQTCFFSKYYFIFSCPTFRVCGATSAFLSLNWLLSLRERKWIPLRSSVWGRSVPIWNKRKRKQMPFSAKHNELQSKKVGCPQKWNSLN